MFVLHSTFFLVFFSDSASTVENKGVKTRKRTKTPVKVQNKFMSFPRIRMTSRRRSTMDGRIEKDREKKTKYHVNWTSNRAACISFVPSNYTICALYNIRKATMSHRVKRIEFSGAHGTRHYTCTLYICMYEPITF